ncbi:perlucin-like protein [Ostrea edulis]|uniref:perlucin-like protein n=1 Tax=Ostrea edulis TaxID=37623 RepID=UPI00209489FF|nr:perlucin-like protein [Ostrea edulis]
MMFILLQEKCRTYGGYLLEADTEEENTWVTNDFLIHPSGCPDWRECSSVWVGASDADTEGTFTWARSKKNLTYLPWKDGQPDDLRGQDCIRIQYTGLWLDVTCNDVNVLNFICEKD